MKHKLRKLSVLLLGLALLLGLLAGCGGGSEKEAGKGDTGDQGGAGVTEPAGARASPSLRPAIRTTGTTRMTRMTRT